MTLHVETLFKMYLQTMKHIRRWKSQLNFKWKRMPVGEAGFINNDVNFPYFRIFAVASESDDVGRLVVCQRSSYGQVFSILRCKFQY